MLNHQKILFAVCKLNDSLLFVWIDSRGQIIFFIPYLRVLPYFSSDYKYLLSFCYYVHNLLNIYHLMSITLITLLFICHLFAITVITLLNFCHLMPITFITLLNIWHLLYNTLITLLNICHLLYNTLIILLNIRYVLAITLITLLNILDFCLFLLKFIC